MYHKKCLKNAWQNEQRDARYLHKTALTFQFRSRSSYTVLYASANCTPLIV